MYTICRAAEHLVDPVQGRWPPDDPTVKTKLVNIRILGHLLAQTFFLSDAAISRVANDILSCRKDQTGTDEEDVEALSKLGEFYRNHLLWPFRKFKVRSPSVSSESSPPSFTLPDEAVDQMLAENPMCCSTSRQLAMQREDFRCIVTRILDISYAKQLPLPDGPAPEVQTLEAMFGCGEGAALNLPKHDYSCNAPWNVLKSLGYTNIVDAFATTGGVHSLKNVMVMTHTLRDHFGTLNLWFEPIEDVPYRYRIRSIWGLPHPLADGQEVTFQSTHPRLLLPNPEYLRIHAVCCRVAHLSGASGVFHELERDLASDPDPTTEASAFARALHARLDHLSWRGAVGDL